MNVKNLFNKRLIWIGAGSLAGMLGSAMLIPSLRKQSGFVGNYSKEITAGVMTVAGSYMLTQSGTVKSLGTGIGSLGIAMLAQSAYQKTVGGDLLPAPNEGTSGNGDDNSMPDFSIPGDVRTA